LTAHVTLADGTQKSAPDAGWQSADPSVVAVSASGVVKAVGRGATDVTAIASGASNTIHVTVSTPIVKVALTYDSHNSVAALSGITNVKFDLSGSTGGGLTYSVSFGDGTADAQDPVAGHVYSSPGSFTAVATVTDAVGQVSTTSRSITVTSLPAISYGTYTLLNDIVNPTTGQRETRDLNFTSQVGHTVTGNYSSSSGGYAPRQFGGTVSDNDDIDLSLADGTIRMVGYVQLAAPYGSSPTALQVTMHGGSADGLILVFKSYSSY
jgi:hypothetical protein